MDGTYYQQKGNEDILSSAGNGLPFGDSDYGTVYATILCLVAAGVAYLLIRRYRAVS